MAVDGDTRTKQVAHASSSSTQERQRMKQSERRGEHVADRVMSFLLMIIPHSSLFS